MFTHIQWFVDEDDNTYDYSPLELEGDPDPPDPNIVPFPSEPEGLQEAMDAGFVTADYENRTFSINLEGARNSANQRVDDRWAAVGNGSRLLRSTAEQLIWLNTQLFRSYTSTQFNTLTSLQRAYRFPYVRMVRLKYGLSDNFTGYSAAADGIEQDLVDEVDASADLSIDALVAKREISLATTLSEIISHAEAFEEGHPLD